MDEFPLQFAPGSQPLHPAEFFRAGLIALLGFLAAAGVIHLLLVGQLLMRRLSFQDRSLGLSMPKFAFAYGMTWAIALSMMPLGYRPFIYFQF